MGSRQAVKEENAEAAAKVTVDEISDLNKERSNMEGTWPQSRSYSQREPEQRGSFLGSVLKSAGEMTGLTSSTNDSNRNADGHTGAQETKGAVMDKAMEYKEYTSEKAKLAADMAKEKAGEYTDYTTEKAREEKEAVAGRMTEIKETTGIAASRAMDHITGKKKEIEDDIAQEKYGKTEPEARKAMQELKLKEEGVYDEDKQRARADWDTAADRGRAARSTIYGAMGSFTEAIKDKLTYPSDIVQEARATQEYGGPKRGRKDNLVGDVEEGPPSN